MANWARGLSPYEGALLAAALLASVVLAAISRRMFRLEWGATVAVALLTLVVFASFIPVKTETVMIETPR